MTKLTIDKCVMLNTEMYLILEFIEEGHFASVYKVLKSSTDEIFALKIMKFEYLHFRNEIECMKKVKELTSGSKKERSWIIQISPNSMTRGSCWVSNSFLWSTWEGQICVNGLAFIIF